MARVVTLVALSALMLTGCGGGGGSDVEGGGDGPDQPPQTATNACVNTAAGQPLTGALPGSGSGANYALGAILPVKGDVAIDITGNYRYTPRTDLPSDDGRARGMDVFSYRLTDPSGLSTEATVTVLIDDAVRVMPLGDSITTGVAAGVPVSEQVSYRRKLYTDLDALDTRYDIDFVGSRSAEGSGANPPLPDRDHEGHPGWCDDNDPPCGVSNGETIDDNITAFLNDNPPDVILLHIGTNHFDVNAAGVDRILDKINNWAAANYPLSVFLARIIPATNGALDVNTYNDNVQAVAGGRPNIRVFIVDQQSELRIASDPNKAEPKLMAENDNLHPNQAGYERMAERWKLDLMASGVLPACQ